MFSKLKKYLVLSLALAATILDAELSRKYKYRCTTSNKTIVEWRHDKPTFCLENPGHTVDWTTLEVTDFRNETDIVQVNSQGITQGIYKSKTFIVDVTDAAVDSITTVDYSFAYPTMGLSVLLTPGTANIGDQITLIAAPDTDTGLAAGNAALGRVTQAVSASDTVFTVDAGVLAVVKVGYDVKLKEGATEEEMGCCTSIDPVNSTITVSSAATQAFAANDTHVLISIKKWEDIEIFGAYPVNLGLSSAGGSPIPAGVVGRLKYKNVSGGTKRFGVILEWLE